MSLPHVTIVVLNWNGLHDTLECLESLEEIDYSRRQTVVVDNGSKDDSVPTIRVQFPTVTVIENDVNLGFAGGNNVGMRYALEQETDHVLLLNNDTRVAPDFLCHLIAATGVDESIGMAGPLIYYADRPDIVWSAGAAIDWQRGNTRMIGLDEQDVGQFGKAPRSVDCLTGCALLVSRELMEEVGLLDERFFAYYEEAEWCVRAARSGYRIVHVPQSHIWHKISKAAREDSPQVHYYMTRNRLLFLKLTRAGWTAWLYTLLAEYLRTLISWSVRPRWRGKHSQRNAMIKAIVDSWRGRWGAWEASA